MTDFHKQVAEALVYERSQGKCEVSGRQATVFLVRRSGFTYRADNLLHVCDGCRQDIQNPRNRQWALSQGYYILSKGPHPETVKVNHARHNWVLFCRNGEIIWVAGDVLFNA